MGGEGGRERELGDPEEQEPYVRAEFTFCRILKTTMRAQLDGGEG